MGRKFSCKLQYDDIMRVANELKQYRADLEKKNARFVDALAKKGIRVIHTVMSTVDISPDEFTWSAEGITEKVGTTCEEKILLSGKRILYVEFGQGIIYSQPQNPKASELGYGVGTNSPQGWAWNLTQFGGGWFFKDGDETKYTKGNRAYMPMYKASKEVRQTVVSTARQIFGG